MKFHISLIATTTILLSCSTALASASADGLKYVWGDALDDPLANGPDGNPYPWETAAKIAGKPRTGRLLEPDQQHLLSPRETREILLKAFMAQERGEYLPGKSFMPPGFSTTESSAKPATRRHPTGRAGRESWFVHGKHGAQSPETFLINGGGGNNQTSNAQQRNKAAGVRAGQGFPTKSGSSSSGSSSTSNTKEDSQAEPEGCVPSRLCPSTYNTTAPLYGVSLTSGQPVTIVQKFPDLLQQVVYQTCKTSECEVIHGECVQTYLPYLFLVIPLGPVTLTGQDYVLIESGCVCRPKYAKKTDEPPPIPFIQPIQQHQNKN